MSSAKRIRHRFDKEFIMISGVIHTLNLDKYITIIYLHPVSVN